MTIVKDWTKYKNFTKKEFDCKFSGENFMQEEFMNKLQELRDMYGKPMKITSGYRSRNHPSERSKDGIGPHVQGLAADIAVQGADAHRLVGMAIALGFTGIGVNQKGNGRFIHLDLVKSSIRPTIWSY
jgi:zinc D-Ala-D-Ala carboxypeptidase